MVCWGSILPTIGPHYEVRSFKPAFSLGLPRWSLSGFFSWTSSSREESTVSCIWNLRLAASILGAKQQKASRASFVILFHGHLFPLLTPCLVSSTLPQCLFTMDLLRVGFLEWLRRLANSLPKTSDKMRQNCQKQPFNDWK